MKTFLLALTLATGSEPERREWKIGDDVREALVYLPAGQGTAAPPAVFAFHGHGGTMRHAARTFALQEHWPEAVVVYLQGLPTPGRLSDPEGKKPGWQHGVGDQGDRDLKFFDAVLAELKEKHRIDPKRVYATGHSNGGAFTYLLWGARPEVFAALAPSAAAGRRYFEGAKPCPVLHVAGEKDATVKFAAQQRTIDAVRAVNGCEGEGREWDKGCTLYPSSKETPVVTFIHPGDHKYPREAPPLIVKYFKEHARK